MLLLLMRHGIAEPLSEKYVQDFDRPLSEKGRHRTRAVAFGLRELVPTLDFLATSPKVRAFQTADIVKEVFGDKSPKSKKWDELNAVPNLAFLKKARELKAETALFVGHEPYLSDFANLILAGNAEAFEVDWKKAGICAIEINGESAVLQWFLGSNVLRKIGLG